MAAPGTPEPIPTRAGLVAERLRALIQAGELAPGDLLRQNEIAQRFGVSTTPVREAFGILMREGLVQQQAHRSVRVFLPSLEELREIYEIRGILEPQATEWATELATQSQLDALSAITDEMRTAPGERYLELNRLLHGTIYDIAARPRLAELIEGLRKTAGAYINMTLDRPDATYAAKVQAEHEQIVSAMRAGDGRAAAKVAGQHLQTTLDRVVEILENQPRGSADAN